MKHKLCIDWYGLLQFLITVLKKKKVNVDICSPREKPVAYMWLRINMLKLQAYLLFEEKLPF